MLIRMQDFIIKRGDRYPYLQTTLSDNNGAVNLAGCTTKFIYRDRNNSTSVPITGSATTVSEVSGVVRYDWSETDTATGKLCYGEFQVTFSDAKIMTFPNDGYICFEILGDLI